MKQAIVTLAVGPRGRWLFQQTGRLMGVYAERIGVPLEVITEIPAGVHPSLGKFKLYDLLQKYDRVCYLDADIVVSPRCPNLFQALPADRMCMALDMITPAANERRRQRYEAITNEWPDLGYSKAMTYIYHSYNAGIMVIPAQFSTLFEADLVELEGLRARVAQRTTHCHEQDLLNHRVLAQDIPVYALPMHWHHMVHDWTNYSRFKSYITHYGYTAQDMLPWDMEIWSELENLDEHAPAAPDMETVL